MLGKITVALTLITALTACSSQRVPETVGYAYPDYWGTEASGPAIQQPASHGSATTGTSLRTTAIFGTRTTAPGGVWLFPPNPYN